MTAFLAALLLVGPAPAAAKATLEVYVSTSANAPGARVLRLSLAGGGAEEIFFEGSPILSADGVASADPVVAPGGRGEVRLRLTSEASRVVADVTSRSVGKRLGIVVNGHLLSAPFVMAPLREGTLVVAGLSLADAQALAPRLGPSAASVRLATSGPPDAAALSALEGTWTVKSATLNGQIVPDRKMSAGTWTFRKGTLELTNGEGETGRFTLATDSSVPSAFRLDPVPPSPERPVWMIFLREGDRLRLAFYDGAAKRPSDFSPESKKVVVEFSLLGSR